MRSRYSAYTRADSHYIQKTMCGKAIEGYDPAAAKQWAQQVKWLGLTVIDAPAHDHLTGTVSFIARYQYQGQSAVIAERSQFKKINGQWFYVDGTSL